MDELFSLAVISTSQLLSSSAIWRSHFNFIFNNQPLLTSTVISMEKSLLLASSRGQQVVMVR
ncbi:hypothetical protein BDF21DRAFT_424960 [Thamnidium elegans]|nr:hypothetical protein BDF21DRAFT_424960 [Thamnidium elegans]